MEAGTRKLIREYGWTVFAAVAVALLIRFYVIEAYRIPTLAMKPTLEPGDTVFVSKPPLGVKLSGLFPLKRGEVVLYAPPLDDEKREYIKRIIGLPGDTVKIAKGAVWVNGKVAEVRIAKNQTCGTETIPGGGAHAICLEPPVIPDVGPIQVPNDSVFVLGDLRTSAQMEDEARHIAWGLVPKSTIRGKVLWVWLSVEPDETGVSPSWFPKLRFERMFRRVE